MRGYMTRKHIGHATLIDHQIPDHISFHNLGDIYDLLLESY